MKLNNYKSKKQTSQKMMRHIKRDIILSYLIAAKLSGNGDIYRTNPTPEGMKRKEMSFDDANMTTLELVFDTMKEAEQCIKDIASTQWLPLPVKEYDAINHRYKLTYQCIKKLRLYYDWMHRGVDREFYLSTIMKYLSTDFLCKRLVQFGLVYEEEDGYEINLNGLNLSDIALFQRWLREIHNIETTRIAGDDYLVFVPAVTKQNIFTRESN